MKYSLPTLLLLIVSASLSQAGSMFGPAPFRNGSPLVSGVDGTYQATARSENLTGVLRFAYSGGTQTADAVSNSWIFFVNGRIVKGSVVANIDESNIDGVLDEQASQGTYSTSASTSGNTTSQSVTLPYIQLNNTSDSASGTFTGKLNLKSPNGVFNGDGLIKPTPGASGDVLIIAEQTNQTPYTLGGAVGVTTNAFVTSTNIPWSNSASSVPWLDFKFRGVRTSIPSSSSSSSTSTTN